MARLPHRPKIQLRLPSTIHPGQTFTAEVILNAKRDVNVEWIEVRLDGIERSSWGSGKSSDHDERTVVALAGRACGERTLPPGRTTLPMRFSIPADCPPTHRGRITGCSYEIGVRASIDWWPDAQSLFEARVTPPPREPVDAEPRLFASRAAGPSATEPHLELSLAADQLSAGQALTGALALFNVQHNRYTRATLAFVGREESRAHDGRVHQRSEAYRYQRDIDVPKAEEGVPIPFRLGLPSDAPPTWSSKLWDLSWNLLVRVERSWGRATEMQVPIVIHPAGTSVRTSRLAPPSVGSERVAAIWSAVAEELGGSVDATGALRRRDGHHGLMVYRDHRGAEGVHVAARLTYPSLRIGLDGGRADGFRRLVGGGVAIGNTKWDRAHYVTSREERQAAHLLSRLHPILVHLRLDDLHDEGAKISIRDAGQSLDKLRRFVADARRLGSELADAMKSMPLPESMEPALDAWERLAGEMSAPLLRGHVGVEGRLDGMEAWAHTVWSDDGRPLHVGLGVRPGFEIDEGRRFDADGEVDAAVVDQLSADAGTLLPSVLGGASRVMVDAEAVRAWLPAPALDVSPVRDQLRRLVRFAALLRVGAGPYR